MGVFFYVAVALTICAGLLLYKLLWVEPRAFLAYYGAQGIKGKWKFLVGQMAEIRDAGEKDQLVELSVATASELGPVHVMLAGPIPQLCVQDLDMLRDIFGRRANCYHKASETLKDILRPFLKNGLLLSEDDHWAKQRRLVSPAFHFANLREMIPLVVTSTQACMHKWVQQLQEQLAKSKASGATATATGRSVQIEISKEMTKLTLNAVSTAAFGSAFYNNQALSEQMTSNLKRVLDTIQSRSLNLTGYLPGIKRLPLFGRNTIIEGCRVLDRIVAQIVAERKAGKSHAIGGRQDLLDLLLSARDDDGAGMSDEAVQDESINFIAAGAETTSNLLSWLIYRLVTEPEHWQLCVDEVDRVLGGRTPDAESLKELRYIEAAAYEALRLHPPAPVLPKYAIKDHQCGKYTIKKGTIVTINTQIVHRDPLLWDEPLAFRPSRFLASASPSASSSSSSSSSSGSSASGSSLPESSSSPSLSDDTDATGDDEKSSASKTKKQHPYAFLAFSAGPRKCIGKNLAMMEIKVIIAMLVQRFRLRLVPGQKIMADPITRIPRYGVLMEVEELASFDPERAPSLSSSSSSSSASVLKPVGMI